MAKADYLLKIREGGQCELREADTEQDSDLVGVELEDVDLSERHGATGRFMQEIVPAIGVFCETLHEAVVHRIDFSFLYHDLRQLERLVSRCGKRINIKIENENTSLENSRKRE